MSKKKVTKKKVTKKVNTKKKPEVVKKVENKEHNKALKVLATIEYCKNIKHSLNLYGLSRAHELGERIINAIMTGKTGGDNVYSVYNYYLGFRNEADKKARHEAVLRSTKDIITFTIRTVALYINETSQPIYALIFPYNDERVPIPFDAFEFKKGKAVKCLIQPEVIGGEVVKYLLEMFATDEASVKELLEKLNDTVPKE